MSVCLPSITNEFKIQVLFFIKSSLPHYPDNFMMENEEKPFVFTPAYGVEANLRGYKGRALAEFSNGDLYD